MRSTGEVMGVDENFGRAFAKSQIGAGLRLPLSGAVFISVKDADKAFAVPPARHLVEMGFELVATAGTARTLEEAGLPVRIVKKVLEGRPHVVDALKNGEIDLVFNTTEGSQALSELGLDPADGTHDESSLLHDDGRSCRRNSGNSALKAGSLEVAPLRVLQICKSSPLDGMSKAQA